jgi:hypothetical protein
VSSECCVVLNRISCCLRHATNGYLSYSSRFITVTCYLVSHYDTKKRKTLTQCAKLACSHHSGLATAVTRQYGKEYGHILSYSLAYLSYSLGSIFINVYMVLFLFNNVIYVYLFLCLCILIVCLRIFIVPAGTLRLP